MFEGLKSFFAGFFKQTPTKENQDHTKNAKPEQDSSPKQDPSLKQDPSPDDLLSALMTAPAQPAPFTINPEPKPAPQLPKPQAKTLEFKPEIAGRKTLSAEDLYSHTNAPKPIAPEPIHKAIPQVQPAPQGQKKMARPASALDEQFNRNTPNPAQSAPQGQKKMAQPLSALDEQFNRNSTANQSPSKLIRSTLFQVQRPEYISDDDEEEILAIRQIQYQKQRQLQQLKEEGSQFTQAAVQHKQDSFQISPTAKKLAQTQIPIQRPTVSKDDPLFDHMSFLNELDNELWFVKSGQSTPQPN